MSVLSERMCVCVPCMCLVPMEARSPESGVAMTVSCRVPGPDLNPLEEQPVCFPAEPSLQPLHLGWGRGKVSPCPQHSHSPMPGQLVSPPPRARTAGRYPGTCSSRLCKDHFTHRSISPDGHCHLQSGRIHFNPCLQILWLSCRARCGCGEKGHWLW